MEFTDRLEQFRLAHEKAKERAAIYVYCPTDPRDQQEILDDLLLLRDEALDKLNSVEVETPESEVIAATAMYLTMCWIVQDFRKNFGGIG